MILTGSVWKSLGTPWLLLYLILCAHQLHKEPQTKEEASLTNEKSLVLTSRTSADRHLSPGRRLGSSSRTRFRRVMGGCASCSEPEVSPSPALTGIQLARLELVLRSLRPLRLSGGLLRMSRSAPRLMSSVLFCDWPRRSSGLFHTPSVICLCR